MRILKYIFTNYYNSDDLFILKKIYYRILSINANTSNNIRLYIEESPYDTLSP